MGAEPWSYFVPFQADVAAALAALRQREFAAGRFDPGPGAAGQRPRTAEVAVELAGADGTRSILDITGGVAPAPAPGHACALSADQLDDLYGTDRPTHGMAETNDDIYDLLGRGECVYVVVYADGQARELFFAGLSFD